MEKKFRPLGITICGVLVAGSLASNAYGDHKCPTESQKIRDGIASAFGKLVGGGMKGHGGCHLARNAGKVDSSVNCNSLTSTDGDASGIFEKARLAFTIKMSSAGMKPGAPGALENFPNCPEPCKTEVGASTPIASYTELGNCLACVARTTIEQRGVALNGNPTEPLGPDEARCAAAIISGYDKRALVALKARDKCRKADEKAGNCALAPCDTSDPKGIVAKTKAKADARIDAACANANLAAVDSCADTNLTDLKACLTSGDDSATLTLFSAGVELP